MSERKVNIIFEPVEHKYTDETGLVYTSATTLIGKYKEPFNKKYWSMYTALKNAGYKVRPSSDLQGIWIYNKFKSINDLYKNPINCQEVNNLLKKWENLTIQACERGNEVHDFLEDSINISKGDLEGKTNDVITPRLTTTLTQVGLDVILKCKHDLDKTKIRERFPNIYDTLLKYINLGLTIFAEKRIYSTTYQIAGMIDVLIVNLRTKEFAILDWKTNKDKMMFQSGYFKKILIEGNWIKGDTYILTGKKLKYPVNNLDDCKGIIYSLQLSLYAYIMELWGFKLVKQGLKIYHIRPNLKPKLIQINYKKAEIAKILNHHRDTRILKKKTNPNKINFGIFK